LLADVLMEVETRVEPWRVRIGEAIGTYRADGWNVGVLERALQAPQPIDAEGLLRAYAAAVDHLRGLEVSMRSSTRRAPATIRCSCTGPPAAARRTARTPLATR